GLSVLSLDSELCDADICPMGTWEAAYYIDDNHLSRAGAMRTVPAIVRALEHYTPGHGQLGLN
ncbi:MAG: SGNH hydrolase domain-containing protein, partial [Gemmatimonadales bacterium]